MTKQVWRIPIIYVILGVLWILLSDSLSSWLFTSEAIEKYSSFQTIKGLFYVVATGIVLYFLIRRSYKHLVSSEDVYRNMFERHPNPMWIYDPKSLKILEVNEAATKAYGYSDKEFTSLKITDIRPQEEVQKLLNNIASERDKLQSSAPWKHQTKSGKVFFVRIFSNVVYRQNEKVRLVTAIDVDESHKAKLHQEVMHRQLIDTGNYLRSLIDSDTAFLIRTDLKGNLTFGNRKFLEKFKYTQSSVLTKSYSEIFHNEDWRVFQRTLVNCKEDPGEVYFTTLRSLTSDHEVIFTEWEFIGISDIDGNVNEIQGVGRNVTGQIKNNQELNRYKQYFSQILSSLNDVVISINASDHSLLFINESCEYVTGYQADEFIENPELWSEIVIEKDRVQVNEILDEIKDSDEEAQFECGIVARNGQIKTLLFRVRGVFNQEESRKEIHGIYSDITQVRSAQKAVSNYAEEIEDILESITEGFFSVDSDLNFDYINCGFEKHTGLDRKELLGKNLWDVFPKDKELAFYKPILATLEGSSNYAFEAYHPQFDKWLYLSVHPKNNGLSVYFEDITQARQARREIRRSQKLLHSIINSTSDLIWSIDKDMNLITANEVFFDHLLGDIKVGQSVLNEIASRPDLMQMWKGFYQKALDNESFIEEIDMISSTEEHQFLEVRFNPLKNENGEVIGVSCFGRNVTHHRILEDKLLQQNEKLREIAHIQSHIVRSPVVNIQGLLKLLDKRDLTSASNEEILKHMENAVKDLDIIIHEIVERANTVERKTRQIADL